MVIFYVKSTATFLLFSKRKLPGFISLAIMFMFCVTF